jgi:hypothetical protein
VKGVRVRTLGHSLQGREISYVSPCRKPRSHSLFITAPSCPS